VAGKTEAKEKKTTATSTKKTPAKKSMQKGDQLVCETCGFAVTIDELSGYAEVHEFVCCGKPMKVEAKKPRARSTKAKSEPTKAKKETAKSKST